MDKEIHLDTCIEGIGAIFDNNIYQAKIPQKLKKFDICALEMLNILVALKVWHSHWQKKNVEIHCDNLAVVTVLQSEKTRDPTLAAISRNIFMLAAQFDIFLKISHVPGKQNIVADLLSRWQNTDFCKNKLDSLVKNYKWNEIKEEYFQIDWEM